MSTLTSSPLIAYRNLVTKNTTITVASEKLTFAAENLGNSLLESLVWQSEDGVSTTTIDVDLITSLPIDIIALLGFNGSDESTRLPKLSNSDTFVPALYSPNVSECFDTTYTHDEDDIPSYGRHIIILPNSTVTARYGRLVIASDAVDYLKASILWLGPIWQFPQSYDISSEATGEYVGTPGIERRIRGWKLIVKALSEQDVVSLESIVNTKLRTGRLILIPHPTKSATFIHEALYCTLVGYKRTYLPIISHDTPWQVEIEFREVED